MEIREVDVYVERPLSIVSHYDIKIARSRGRFALIVESDSELGVSVGSCSDDNANHNESQDCLVSFTNDIVAPDRATTGGEYESVLE